MSHASHTSHTKTYLIACGGTGGHLAPGIALAEGLLARGHRPTLLISTKKIDTRLAEKYPHLAFLRIPSAPLSKNPLRLLLFFFRQLHGLLFSINLVRKTKPDAIVGFGGFTTAAIILAGALYRVPIALHEANRVPGRAIRLFRPLATRIFLPLGVALPDSTRAHQRPMGLPVRKEIRREPRDTARAALGLAPDRPVLVILGGSQGATPLNTWTRQNLPALTREGIQVYCVTGPGKTPDAPASQLPVPTSQFPVPSLQSTVSAPTQPLTPPGAAAPTANSKPKTVNCPPPGAVFTPFCDRMATLLSAADLVVSRAGAGTIAELIRCATPAILIPYPQAADDHQHANALYFEQQGGGIVIEQTRLDTLHREVRDIIFNDWLMRKFRENLTRMDRANSLDILLDDLEQIATPATVAQAAEPARPTPAA